MAKLTDKFFNRVIEGPLVLEEAEKEQVTEAVEADSSIKIFENIVDKDGHKRFIEGDITINEISGVTQTYGKWALSGSHLLIVLAINIANNTELSGGILTTIDSLPQWVKDKVVPLYATTIVTNQQFQAYGDDYSAQNIGVSLQKSSNVFIYVGAFTASKDRHCRIAYDLLIDNE